MVGDCSIRVFLSIWHMFIEAPLTTQKQPRGTESKVTAVMIIIHIARPLLNFLTQVF